MSFEIGSIYKKGDSFGLDVGTHSLKVCQLKKQGKLTKLVGYGAVEIPKNIIIEGIISDPEEVAKILKTLIDHAPWGNITAQKVVASLPESKIFTRILELPDLSHEKINEAVHWEAEQYIPVPVADLYIDWEIVHKGTPIKATKKGQKPTITNNEVLLVATPKSIVDSYLQVFKILDLEPSVIEMSLMSTTRSLITPKMKGAVLVANMGAEATDIGIVVKGDLRLSGSTPTGGDVITGAISEKLKISISEADSIKKKYGINPWELSDKVLKAVEPVLNQVTGEIERIIKYYEERIVEAAEFKISRILLTGGTSNLPGILGYIQKKFSIPTDLGNPWSNITIYPLKPVPKSEVSIYSTAIGLALRGIEK